MQQENSLCVYMHTSPSGKVYIGQTNNPQRRWNRGHGYRGTPHLKAAIDKYGWNSFRHEIVADHLTQAEANDLEKTLIQKYQSTNPKFGYNIQDGGRSAGGMSPEAKAHMIACKRGANAPNARPVTSFDLNGNRLESFWCVTDAALHYGIRKSTLLTHLSKGSGTCSNMIFHYSERVEGVQCLPEQLIYKPHEKRSLKEGSHCCPLVLFDNEGRRYKEFGSISETAKFLSVCFRTLNEAVQTLGRKCRGYYPVRKEVADQYDRLPIETFSDPYACKRKLVSQYSQDGMLCGVYSSISEAADQTNIASHAISLALRKGSLSGGYQWRYGSPESLLIDPKIPKRQLQCWG